MRQSLHANQPIHTGKLKAHALDRKSEKAFSGLLTALGSSLVLWSGLFYLI